jgi:RNA polymerase sigma-70 factor, ECF subfamily
MEPDPDAFLVAQARSGSRVAFEMLMLKHQRRIERLLARSVRESDEVADLCQETFLRAWRALPDFRGESAFYTWLYRIAVNAAARHGQRAARRATTDLSSNDVDGTFPSEADQSHDETPEALLASRQMATHLNDAVDALAEDQRRALLLREVDGLSYEEIGELMQCPPGTVRSRIFRARETVAAKLRPLLDRARGGRRW